MVKQLHLLQEIEVWQFLVPKQSFGLEMSSNVFDNKREIEIFWNQSHDLQAFITCMQRSENPRL